MKGLELSNDPIAAGPMILAYVEFGEYDKALDLFSGVTPGHPLYDFGLSMEKVMQGDFAGALEIIENSVDDVENPRQIQLGLMTTFSAFAGDFDKARKYTEQQFPEFAADANPEVDAVNVASLIGYAFILQKLGENQRADALLEAALPVVRTLPRVGLVGHGIRDVQILALQGRTSDALSAFRDALDQGFRGTVASNGWPLAIDPYLETLRDQPAFRAMIKELDFEVTQMQQRLSQAEQSGNWDELRTLVTST
jgi:tetratricopeptide (TPR) repeat protein